MSLASSRAHKSSSRVLEHERVLQGGLTKTAPHRSQITAPTTGLEKDEKTEQRSIVLQTWPRVYNSTRGHPTLPRTAILPVGDIRRHGNAAAHRKHMFFPFTVTPILVGVDYLQINIVNCPCGSECGWLPGTSRQPIRACPLYLWSRPLGSPFQKQRPRRR